MIFAALFINVIYGILPNPALKLSIVSWIYFISDEYYFAVWVITNALRKIYLFTF